MSRRRESYSPYRPITNDAYFRAVYGCPRRRRPRPAYLRVVESRDVWRIWRLWLGAALSLIVTIWLCLVVLGVWALARRLLGVL